MSPMSRFQKVLLSMGAISGVTYYYINTFNEKKVYTSWTTNSIPSVKWDDNWDHRSPRSLLNPKKLKSESDEGDNQTNEKIESMRPKATRHLILIRHGQYNLEGTNDEQRILTELGRCQAQSTGARLKELDLPYTDMVKSTMSRAQETGTLISKCLPDVPVKNCDFLREGAPAVPEPPIGHWKPEAYFHQDGARIETAFRHYFYRASPEQETDSYTILVCHANVIRYFVCRALQFPPEAWLRLSLNHASITWLSVTPGGRVILRGMGDTGHMPPKMITSR